MLNRSLIKRLYNDIEKARVNAYTKRVCFQQKQSLVLFSNVTLKVNVSVS